MAPRASIFIWFNAQSVGFHDQLARQVKQRFGWDTVLFCTSRADLPSDGSLDLDAFAEIIETKDLMRVNRSLPFAERPDELERRIGFDISQVLCADRHVGRPWVLGGRYPRSRYAVDVSLDEAVEVVVRLARRFESAIERWRPIVAMILPGTIATATLYNVAQARGVPIRILSLSRIPGRFYWGISYDQMAHGFRAALTRRLASQSPEFGGDVVNLPPPQRAQMFFAKMHAQTRPWYLLRQILTTLRNYVAKRRRAEKMVYGDYLLGDQLLFWVRYWIEMRRGLSRPRIGPSLSPKHPFVLFLLQREPETSIMAEAPMAANQLSIIDLLSRTLPAGWRLVVKEHPAALGMRPNGFYNQICRYPNVLLASARDDARELSSKAKAVAVINSTVGIQAAVAGQPVLTFHPNFPAIGLPHVFAVESYANLKEALHKIRDDQVAADPLRRSAGRALHQAMLDTSFELDAPRLTNPHLKQPLSKEAIDRVIETLLATLDLSEPRTKASL